MAIATTKIAETFLNVATGVPIPCDWPLYDDAELVVVYGQASLEAQLNTHYTVALSPPDYDQFTVTPTAALLTLINNLITADPTNEINYITVRRDLDYLTSAQPEAVRGVGFLSREIERLWMAAQQVAENAARCLAFPTKEVGNTANPPTLPPKSLRANKALIFDSDGNPIASDDDYNDQLADVTAQAVIAVDAAADALSNKNLTDANVVATAQNEADTLALLLQAQAAAAQAASAAAEGLYRDVVAKSANFAPAALEEGTLYRVDASGGPVVVSLSSLATYGEDMTYAFVKVDNSVNTVTINRGGTDTINGGTSVVLGVQWETHALVGDLGTGNWVDVIQAAVVPDGSVTAPKIASDAVTTIKIQNSAVTPDKTNIAANEFFAAGSDGVKAKKPISDNSLSFLNTADAAAKRTALGITPTAIGQQIFTANGTYTPTAGMIYCVVEAVGGGGGGAGALNASGAGGGGGGAGAYARRLLTAADIGASKAVTIGTGGTAGTGGASPGAGGAGGATSLGTLVVAGGGAGGTYAASIAPGGVGGTATAGDLLVQGGVGGYGLQGTGANIGGHGGSGFFGNGGRVSGVGGAYGGGANGGSGGGGNGGVGSPGVIIITEYL